MAKIHKPEDFQIHPRHRHLFDKDDQRAYFDEMERRYRLEQGLPGRGEGWVSEAHLAHCVEEVLPGKTVVREARLPWLGNQRLDVFVPELRVAFEYQGEQHFYPIEPWGGDAGLHDRRGLDERKKVACRNAGVLLIEWHFSEPISAEAVLKRLVESGIDVEEFRPSLIH